MRQKTKMLFIHSPNKYLLSIPHVLTSGLGTENTGMTTEREIPASIEFTFGCGRQSINT